MPVGTTELFRQLIHVDDETWEKLSRTPMEGFPVYYRWFQGSIQLWPFPYGKEKNWVFGCRYTTD